MYFLNVCSFILYSPSPHCSLKFCLSHILPEAHGCGPAAKALARAKWLADNSLTTPPKPKPVTEANRALLAARLNKKIEKGEEGVLCCSSCPSAALVIFLLFFYFYYFFSGSFSIFLSFFFFLFFFFFFLLESRRTTIYHFAFQPSRRN